MQWYTVIGQRSNAYGAEDNPLKTDALALAYASDDAGNKEAAKSAWKVANTSSDELFKLTKTGDYLSSGENSTKISFNTYKYGVNKEFKPDKLNLNEYPYFSNTELKPAYNQNNQTIGFDSKDYQIYVPSNVNNENSVGWKTVKTINDNHIDFSWLEFFTGIELDDVNGILDSTNQDTSVLGKGQLLGAGALSVLGGIFDSASNSINNSFISMSFQTNGTNNRVIIKAGSSNTLTLHSKYAHGKPISLYSEKLDYNTKKQISQYAQELYEQITGKTANHSSYDIQITLDPKRNSSAYSSYIGVDENGNFSEYPIVYSGDKIELGERIWGLKTTFKPLITLSPYGSRKLGNVYIILLNKLLQKNDLKYKK